ncbi:hypothetical protein V494_05029, partial [Pseudogymnoascus sp. VKM F-4513 (FW-928)]
MGGSTPLNIFKLNRGDDPPEVFNWKLWLAVLSFGIMGAARGVDEGLISGTLSSANFRDLLDLPGLETPEYATVKANISSMVQIGSVAGAGLAFVLCDRIGRIWATRQLCALWIFGIVIFMCNNGNINMVYAGRFIAGLGIGQTTVIAPVYLSEIAPKSIRGLCTVAFGGSSYIGIMLAYFASWGASLHISDATKTRWLVPTSLHLMFAGLIGILSFFNYESPRYLVKKGQNEHATINLARIRNLHQEHDLIIREIYEIQAQLEEEEAATLGQGWLGVLREMFLMPSNLYRIYLGLFAQLMTQWSGAQSITVYAPDFFLLLGISGQNEKLLATCVFGVVKFAASLVCAFFLVDIIGRKRSLGYGITLQAIAMGYIALFLTIVGTPEADSFTTSQKAASTGAVIMIYISGFGFAMGWNSIQYLLNAELYPLRIRAISSSLVMMAHFANQYGCNRAVPIMLLPTHQGGLGPAGAFWFFVGITVLGGMWAWFFVPETAGRSLESMDEMFTLRWWEIGRYGAKVGGRGSRDAREGKFDEAGGVWGAVQVERLE